MLLKSITKISLH